MKRIESIQNDLNECDNECASNASSYASSTSLFVIVVMKNGLMKCGE